MRTKAAVRKGQWLAAEFADGTVKVTAAGSGGLTNDRGQRLLVFDVLMLRKRSSPGGRGVKESWRPATVAVAMSCPRPCRRKPPSSAIRALAAGEEGGDVGGFPDGFEGFDFPGLGFAQPLGVGAGLCATGCGATIVSSRGLTGRAAVSRSRFRGAASGVSFGWGRGRFGDFRAQRRAFAPAAFGEEAGLHGGDAAFGAVDHVHEVVHGAGADGAGVFGKAGELVVVVGDGEAGEAEVAGDVDGGVAQPAEDAGPDCDDDVGFVFMNP